MALGKINPLQSFKSERLLWLSIYFLDQKASVVLGCPDCWKGEIQFILKIFDRDFPGLE